MVLYSTKDWTVWRERHAIRPGHSPDYMLEWCVVPRHLSPP